MTAQIPDLSRWTLRAVTVVAITIALAGCTSGSSKTVPTLEPLVAAEVISRSSEALTGLTTFRFGLTHGNGNTVLVNGIEVQRATGAAVTPDRYTLDADTLVSGFFVNSQVVVIGADSYMTHPVTRRWQLLEPEASPFRSFDPVSLVGSILGQITDVSTAPAGSGPGDTYAIDGELPAAALTALTGGVDEAAPPLAVRVIVDGKTMYPIEARITGRATSTEQDNLVRTVRLFDFNSDIAIESPI